jgi:hypothetical protein
MGEGKGNENIPWIYKGINFQTLGKQIKKYRVLRGLRQSDLAELVFSTTNTISRIEIGGIGCSLENLLRIADALEVSPDALLFGNFNPMYSRFYPYFWDMKEEILRKMEENLSEIFKEISTKEQLTFVERDFQKWLKMTKQDREEEETLANEKQQSLEERAFSDGDFSENEEAFDKDPDFAKAAYPEIEKMLAKQRKLKAKESLRNQELQYSVENYLFPPSKVADPEEKIEEEAPVKKKTKTQLRKEEKARQRENARKEKQLTQEEQRQRVRKDTAGKKK